MSKRLGRLGLQGDGGSWRRRAKTGARLETQGAAVQAREVDSQEAKQCEEQHGNGPLADSRGGTQQPGVEDDHFTQGSRAHSHRNYPDTQPVCHVTGQVRPSLGTVL